MRHYLVHKYMYVYVCTCYRWCRRGVLAAGSDRSKTYPAKISPAPRPTTPLPFHFRSAAESYSSYLVRTSSSISACSPISIPASFRLVLPLAPLLSPRACHSPSLLQIRSVLIVRWHFGRIELPACMALFCCWLLGIRKRRAYSRHGPKRNCLQSRQKSVAELRWDHEVGDQVRIFKSRRSVRPSKAFPTNERRSRLCTSASVCSVVYVRVVLSFEGKYEPQCELRGNVGVGPGGAWRFS